MNYHLDYETFSTADLTVVGQYRYASHPSTEVLMVAIASDTEGPYLLVNPKYGTSDPRAKRLLLQMSRDTTADVYAHFAGFEIAISRYRWHDLGLGALVPAPALLRWRCTAALCRVAGVPDSLEMACLKLNLRQKKDPRGKALIQVFCVPQADGTRVLPKDRPVEWRQFCAYCVQDVVSEKGLKLRLTPFILKGVLLDTWLFDLKLNNRGIPLNRDAVRRARKIAQEASGDLSAQFVKIAGYNPTQRGKVKQLLADLGVRTPDMKAKTLETLLATLKPGKPRDILVLYALVRFAAVKKLDSMLACVCDDGWVRGTMLFYGAGTGRWAGRLVQPHNLRKPTIKGTDHAYEMICKGATRADLDLLWGNALEVVASCIRNFIQWSEGKMLDADYNAIEARIVCWLADQTDVLDEYRRGVDQYKAIASLIYGKPVEAITKEERELGKRAWLGCGFQMAGAKFRRTCSEQYSIFISQALADRGVLAYRTKCHRVKDMWYAMDRAARNAINLPGRVFKVGTKLSVWRATIAEIPYLFMRLPSGRTLNYPWPKIEVLEGDDRAGVTFYGEYETGKWGRIKTYGGKLIENATQATAFDYMAHGAVQAEAAGFPVILLVHDQALALHRNASFPVKQYTDALTSPPRWATGLPIVAEGKIVPYYRK